MKVAFSSVVPYVPEWNGNRNLPEAEQIKCKLSVLNMIALMDLLDAFTEFGLKGEVDTDTVKSEQIRPILKQFGHLLPEYVKEFTGLTDEQGNAITLEALCNYPTFMNLSLELLMKLSQISSPSEEDTKNSKEPSV